MTYLRAQPATTRAFIQLIVGAGCLVRNEFLTSFAPESVAKRLVDLDRLWHDGHALVGAVDLLETAFSEWKLDERARYDTIIAASSLLAAYGSIPIASALASRFGDKSLVLLVQTTAHEYNLYPSALSWEQLVAGKRVVLLQDAMVYGRSVDRVCRLIRQKGAALAALVVLVDQQPPDRRLPETLAEAPIFVLATGADITGETPK
jgi:orotate phosphoribosyltransferase